MQVLYLRKASVRLSYPTLTTTCTLLLPTNNTHSNDTPNTYRANNLHTNDSFDIRLNSLLKRRHAQKIYWSYRPFQSSLWRFESFPRSPFWARTRIKQTCRLEEMLLALSFLLLYCHGPLLFILHQKKSLGHSDLGFFYWLVGQLTRASDSHRSFAPIIVFFFADDFQHFWWSFAAVRQWLTIDFSCIWNLILRCKIVTGPYRRIREVTNMTLQIWFV